MSNWVENVRIKDVLKMLTAKVETATQHSRSSQQVRSHDAAIREWHLLQVQRDRKVDRISPLVQAAPNGSPAGWTSDGSREDNR
jgi:hypothetical protein